MSNFEQRLCLQILRNPKLISYSCLKYEACALYSYRHLGDNIGYLPHYSTQLLNFEGNSLLAPAWQK